MEPAPVGRPRPLGPCATTPTEPRCAAADAAGQPTAIRARRRPAAGFVPSPGASRRATPGSVAPASAPPPASSPYAPGRGCNARTVGVSYVRIRTGSGGFGFGNENRRAIRTAADAVTLTPSGAEKHGERRDRRGAGEGVMGVASTGTRTAGGPFVLGLPPAGGGEQARAATSRSMERRARDPFLPGHPMAGLRPRVAGRGVATPATGGSAGNSGSGGTHASLPAPARGSRSGRPMRSGVRMTNRIN